MGAEIADRMDVVLRDKGSRGGLTAEPLCSMLIVDILVLGTIAAGKEPAVTSYEC